MVQQAKDVREGVGGANVEFEAETVIATVEGISTGPGHGTVFLEAMASVTTGAGSAKVTLRIRREGVGGTEVAKAVALPSKSGETQVPFQCNDVPPGEVANGQYVLTAQHSAAEKAKSVNSRITATF